MSERASQVAEQLEGTCKALSDFATPEEIDSIEFCQALDDKVMCCTACNWWVEASEVDEDGICSDC